MKSKLNKTNSDNTKIIGSGASCFERFSIETNREYVSTYTKGIINKRIKSSDNTIPSINDAPNTS